MWAGPSPGYANTQCWLGWPGNGNNQAVYTLEAEEIEDKEVSRLPPCLLCFVLVSDRDLNHWFTHALPCVLAPPGGASVTWTCHLVL